MLLLENLRKGQNILDKKEKIIKKIGEFGKLDDGLKNNIVDSKTLIEFEDLYWPYKNKKQTNNKSS